MRSLLIALALLFAAGPALADDAALNALTADYTSYAMGQDPIVAGRAGDKKALARMPDVSPGADVLRKSFLEEFKERLVAIDPAGLTPEGRQRRDALDHTLTERLRSLSADEARLPFDKDSGFDVDVAKLAASTRLDSEADALAWIARVKALPRYYAANVENARRGVKTGLVRSPSAAEAVLARAKAAVAAPVEQDPLLTPFDRSNIPTARLAELGMEAAVVIRDQVRPAQQAFVTFLETEYLPASRKTPAPSRR
ncbi:MAG: DUF885 family protein [Phenylobacterium sp.]